MTGALLTATEFICEKYISRRVSKEKNSCVFMMTYIIGTHCHGNFNGYQKHLSVLKKKQKKKKDECQYFFTENKNVKTTAMQNYHLLVTVVGSFWVLWLIIHENSLLS